MNLLRPALLGLAALLSACSGPAQPQTERASDPARHSTPPVGAAGAPEGASRAAGAPAAAAPSAGDTARLTMEKDCASELRQAEAKVAELLAVDASGGPRTLENTVVPFDRIDLHLDRAAGAASLMSAVHPSAAVRDAARACEQKVEAFRAALSLNRAVYSAFSSLDTTAFDTETKRLVAHVLRDFRRAGVDRDDKTRERLTQIADELIQLSQEFEKNIAEDTRSVLLPGREALAGVPDDFVAAHPPDERGQIKITTDYPDYLPFIKYADSAEWRKQLYMAFKSRGAGKNEDILRKILTLRDEKAKLLGYRHFADYITEDKMARSAERAASFIEQVAKIAKARSQRDYGELLARKRKDIAGATLVEDYEKVYYAGKVQTERYAFDPQEVRPYFPYAQVEKGLLDITAAIYGIRYEPNTSVPLWHPDVKAFDVMRDGTLIGRIYLDMHPRPDKYKHAAQFSYRVGHPGEQLPEGVLVCNFPSPQASGGPALMEHDDVVTMFHEFGHLMHHVFGGGQRWHRYSGVETEWDFAEAPSQMFEEWAWNHNTLKTFAKHHETGQEIPADVVTRMRRAEKFGLGTDTAQQLFYAALSLRYHMEDPAKLDMDGMVRRLQAKYTPFRYVEGTAMHANFGHLSGYSAMYYTYMWSLVIAKDLLTPFEKHGLMNTEWTGRYRDRVLAPGGSKDAAELVRDFLGRQYSFAAFEKYLSK